MASLNMSLEDMIKSRKTSVRGRGRGRGRWPGGSSYRNGRAYGGSIRGSFGLNARSTAHPIAKTSRRTRSFPWQNGMLEDSLKAAGLSGLINVTKLYVSNLDIGVTNDDIRELFSEVGELKSYAIHYDKNARPNGSAEVIFVRRSDAFQALKRYNNVQLDGKPMKVEIIGANAEIPISARVNVVGGSSYGKRAVFMGPGAVRFRGGLAASNRVSVQRGRGGRGRGRDQVRGRGRGRGIAHERKKAVDKSADELDKELEHYHAEAMQS